MKKLLLALFAAVSMALAFTSCEGEDINDPTVYCWEVTYSMEFLGITMTDSIDLPMTNADKKELAEQGEITYEGVTMNIVSIKKQSFEECEGLD